MIIPSLCQREREYLWLLALPRRHESREAIEGTF